MYVKKAKDFSFKQLAIPDAAKEFLLSIVSAPTFLAIMRFKFSGALMELGLNYFVNAGSGGGSAILLLNKDMYMYAASMGKDSVAKQLQNIFGTDDSIGVLRKALIEARYIDEDYEILHQQCERIKKLFSLDSGKDLNEWFINDRVWPGRASEKANELWDLHKKYEENRFTASKSEEAMEFLNKILNEKFFKRADWFILHGDACDEQQYCDIVWPLKEYLSSNKEYAEKIKKIIGS